MISPVSAGEKGGLMSKQTDSREIARGYFNRITSGHKNTVSRPDLSLPGNESIDRQLRILVEEANHNGDCIINVGNGYYRPIPGDPVDELEFKEYTSKDDSRADKLWSKIYSMHTTFDNWRKEGERAVQIRNQREAAGAE